MNTNKAPDKIYVAPVGTWDTEHIPDLQDNIYIRKASLLEWAKGFTDTKIFVSTLIDKLNQL